MKNKIPIIGTLLIGIILLSTVYVFAASEKNMQGLIMYPKSDSVVQSAKPIIGADFKNMISTGDILKPTLLLDGTDITSQCDIQSDYILCVQKNDISPGEHDVQLKLNNQNKVEWKTAWKFTVGWKPSERFMYPNPGKAIDNDQPVIGLNFSEFPIPLNPESVQLLIDGQDVSYKAHVSEDTVFFQPDSPLEQGAHKIVVKARTSSGSRIEPVTWNLVVGEQADVDTAIAQTIPRYSYSKMIAYTGTRLNTIAGASRRMDNLFGEPVHEERETTYASHETSEKDERLAHEERRQELLLAKQEYIENTGLMLGNSYAMEVMGGFEYLDVSGDYTRSSQLERSAFIHTIGLRTQTNLLDNSLEPQALNIDFKMAGTSDGDASESMWDLKSLTARYKVANMAMAAYDIRPKYTTYSLSGKPLLGFQVDVDTGTNKRLNFIAGKFKNNTAGKHVELQGARYSSESSNGNMTFGAHYVKASIKQLRGGDTSANSLFGFNLSKRSKSGDTNFEWASSNYSGLGNDTAYKINKNYRKGKANVQLGYEEVGSNFRTELGFASKGLTEFSSQLQYQISKRLTTVIGLKNRSFKDGGSKSISIPFIAKAQLLKKRPSFKFDFKHQSVLYSKASSTKDTYTDVFTFQDNYGESMWAFSLKKEKKERNDRLDENEEVSNLKITHPITEKLKFVYGLTKLDNNIFGPETTNAYSLSYDLSDWSDVNYSFKTINKLNPFQDRRTMKFRYGLINPENSSEVSFEFSKNMYIDYDETFSTVKYSKFY